MLRHCGREEAKAFKEELTLFLFFFYLVIPQIKIPFTKN